MSKWYSVHYTFDKNFFSVKKGAGEEEKECREKRENVDKKSAQTTRQIDSRTLAL